MSRMFQGWPAVAARLDELVQGSAADLLNDGQKWSLRKIAQRLPENGLVLADEVGMGKTRIACAVANAVVASGGRVAVLVPPGLGYQWRDELRVSGISAPPILRSLWQYLKAWENLDDAQPWFAKSCLIVSHAFSNWRLGESSDPWRWSLLPEIYAHWRKKTEGRLPRNYQNHDLLIDDWTKNAADSIVSFIHQQGDSSNSWPIIDDLATKTPWPGALEAGKYRRNADLRRLLETAVGLGLGVFDLVIIDEAHKSRGADSLLSTVLAGVILHSCEARRLAMSATPVELGIEQWSQTLGRVGVAASQIQSSVMQYADAVQSVRLTPRDPQTRGRLNAAARSFEKALGPFFLRRDKREDELIKNFVSHTGEGYHDYRKLTEISIQPNQLSRAWKQAVCAAEALSFASSQADHPIVKRVRLTFGNGHGIASLIDRSQKTGTDDAAQHAADSIDTHLDPPVGRATETKKRVQRIEWWRDVLARPFEGTNAAETALYDHPAILAAVSSIEETAQRGEKILVFGRFTRPMRALVNLLNARKMLNVLDSADGLWAQEQIHESEWPAIEAAHRQLGRPVDIQREDVNSRLKARYRQLEAKREIFRDTLVSKLERGFSASGVESALAPLFLAFRSAVAKSDPERRTLATIARALSDHLGSAPEGASEADLVIAFSELVTAASDHDAESQTDQPDLSEEEADERWESIENRVREEYSHAQGGFARLMHGGSLPATRRLLQLAFNRRNAFPQVLVTQSMVGREGLNLHKACRTVLLLHPEWNPGVVEQQIGRVDRLGSLWEEMVGQAIARGASPQDVPRIEIKPIVFEGTYDEANWQILKARWDQLRAQLHGVILTCQGATSDPESDRLFDEINRLAPNFSPVPRD